MLNFSILLSGDMDSMLAILGTFSAIAGLLSLACCVVIIASNWRIFTKAGVPGWYSIIPILNSYTLFKIAWGNGWMFLTQLIPFIGWVFGIIVYHKLAISFGRGIGTTIGLIVLPVIFMPMLAFGNSAYMGPAVSA